MNIAVLVKGVAWTTGFFGLGQLVRLVSSVILTRLLAPEAFGIMVIIYTLQYGIELLSDVGFVQSIVTNNNADKPEFYNSVWSLRLVRSVLLWLGCIVAALPVAHLYNVPMLAWILPVMGMNFVVTGLGSLAVTFVQKQLQMAKLNLFVFIVEVATTVGQIIFAYFSPTVWALVFGGFVSAATGAIGSYLLVPNLRHKFHISREYSKEIFSFGKWIYASSAILFLSTSFDNLYFGKVLPLELLGVYGIARNLSGSLFGLIGRVNYQTIFPFIASHSELPRADLRAQLKSVRANTLLIVALGFSILVTFSDLLVRTLYDPRYENAGWMLSVMLIGKWFLMISSINETTLVALRKPLYSAYANAFKFGLFLIGLPITFLWYGIVGAIIFTTVIEFLRYFPILIGQVRERFSFFAQDAVITLLMFVLMGFWEWLRWNLGLGSSFKGLLSFG